MLMGALEWGHLGHPPISCQHRQLPPSNTMAGSAAVAPSPFGTSRNTVMGTNANRST